MKQEITLDLNEAAFLADLLHRSIRSERGKLNAYTHASNYLKDAPMEAVTAAARLKMLRQLLATVTDGMHPADFNWTIEIDGHTVQGARPPGKRGAL